MSKENVELVRSLYEGGAGRWFELLDEAVELDFRAFPVPDSPILRGKNAVVKWSHRCWGTWDEYALEAIEIIDAGERVVVVQSERGRGRESGVRLERVWAAVYTVQDGKVVRFQSFKTRDEAREAAGLSK
jgi:ketosteroid isomerase-like protein